MNIVGTPGARANFVYDQGDTKIDVVLPPATQLSAEQQQLTSQLDAAGISVTIAEPSPESNEAGYDFYLKYYSVDGRSRREFRLNEDEKKGIRRTDTAEVARVIDDLKGDEIVIYTGAGISMAGGIPVMGIGQLNKALHVDGSVDTLLQDLNDPQAHEQIEQAYAQFIESFYADSSTPAHDALATLAREKEGVQIFTENLDMKHEASGIYPIHLDPASGSYEAVGEAASHAKLLITIGLNQDDRSMIARMKEANPELQIIAVTLSAENGVRLPTFLDPQDTHDQVLLGDCQETLPALVKLLQVENQQKVEGERNALGNKLTTIRQELEATAKI